MDYCQQNKPHYPLDKEIYPATRPGKTLSSSQCSWPSQYLSERDLYGLGCSKGKVDTTIAIQ